MMPFDYSCVLFAILSCQAWARRNADRSTVLLVNGVGHTNISSVVKEFCDSSPHAWKNKSSQSKQQSHRQNTQSSNSVSSFFHISEDYDIKNIKDGVPLIVGIISFASLLLLSFVCCMPRHAEFVMSEEFVVDVPTDKLVKFITPRQQFVPIILDLEGNNVKVEDKGNGHFQSNDFVLIGAAPFPIHVMDRAVLEPMDNEPAKLVYSISTGEDLEKPIFTNDQVWEFFPEANGKCRVKRTVTNFHQYRKLFIPGQTLLKWAIMEELERFREYFANPANEQFWGAA